MSETSPFIEPSDRSSNRIARQSNRFLNFLAVVLTFVVIFLIITRRGGFYSQYISQYNYRQIVWSDSDTETTAEGSAVSATSIIPAVIPSTTAPKTTTKTTTIAPTKVITTTKTTKTTPTTTVLTTTTKLTASTVAKAIDNEAAAAIPGSQSYITASFFATCGGGGIGNKLYEFVSLYGIARTLNRVPYVNLTTANDCILNQMKEMTSYFPQIALAIEIKVVSRKLTVDVDFGAPKCCHYYNVTELFKYNSSRFINLSGRYLQSYKYFEKYKAEVLKLLAFTQEDIATTDRIAKETFKNDTNHKLCVQIRRGDYLKSGMHRHTTEDFTKASVLYVREKLLKAAINSTVAFLGDDRPWAKTLFNESWAHVPERTNRTTTDLAFVARHCQTIIITASASSFGFWGAYLSSADIYYNVDFSKSASLTNEFTPNDVYPPKWKSISMNNATHNITEVPRVFP